MEVNVSFAILLTTLAGLTTGIGSAIAYFIRRPKYSYLAIMLGFSAGVMIYISFAELLKTAIDEVGFAAANLGFFIGIIFIAIVDMLIPHEYEEERVESTHPGVVSGSKSIQEKGGQLSSSSSAGQSSVLMRAGIMVYISLDELLPLAHRYGQEHLVIMGIGAGMLVMAASLFLLT
jgi:zinc transporter ZupT